MKIFDYGWIIDTSEKCQSWNEGSRFFLTDQRFLKAVAERKDIRISRNSRYYYALIWRKDLYLGVYHLLVITSGLKGLKAFPSHHRHFRPENLYSQFFQKVFS